MSTFAFVLQKGPDGKEKKFRDLVADSHDAGGSLHAAGRGKQKGNRRKKHAFMDKLRELQKREFGLVKTKSNKNIRMTVCSELGDDLGLAEAQRWLGHNQLSTTEKYYLKSRKNDENRREYLRRTQLHPDMTLLKAQ